MKPAIRSALAGADIEAAIMFYVDQVFYVDQARHMVDAFVDALEQATRHIENHPASGLPRYAHELNIPQLRCRGLRRVPYALFYIEHTDHLDVIRCVHVSRDIPLSLQSDTPEPR